MPVRAAQILVRQAGKWAAVPIEGPSPELARRLSREHGLALELLLDTGAFAMELRTFQGGELTGEERDPQPPAFRDVEQIASELLAYLGVPSPLCTFPCAPDAIVESAAGELRAIEVRHLPDGVPDEAWADPLAALEEAQARRLLAALARDADGERVPLPTFAYQPAEPPMHAARARRPWLVRLATQAPLSHAGFTAHAAARLEDVTRANALHLEVAAPFGWVRAPAREAYARYVDSLDAAGAIAWLVAETQRRFAAKPATREALLPTLTAEGPALLCDDGERIVRVADFDDDDFAAALANADALLVKAPEAVRWFDAEHGRVVSCEFDDPAAAGRLYSPLTRRTLLGVLGEERCVAAAPTRDSLLACALDDPDAVEWLAEEARRRFAEGPYPVSPQLWVVGENEIAPVEA